MRKKISVIVAVVLVSVLTFAFMSEAYEMPQKYSSDTYGDPIPEVQVPPEPEEQKIILAYFNGEAMNLKVSPVYKKGILYVPAKEFFLRVGMNVTMGGTVEISNGVVTAKFKKSGSSLTINGTETTLAAKPKKIKGVLMVPAELVSKVLNAKVWYDEASKTFAVSTGSFKNDDILRVINYKFWMNGEPFYELSFNKFDLFRQVASFYSRAGEWPELERTRDAAEAALKQLNELGFRTIRCFVDIPMREGYFRSDLQVTNYYKVMDDVFGLCEKYNIQVNCCLNLPSNDFSPKEENYFDLICNKNSQSRQNLYKYLDEFVGRYKNSKAVLMWEVVNEGNLDCDVGWALKADRPSLYQLGEFYADVADKIRSLDPDRLVTGGDSCFRASQWHQYLGVKEGMIGVNWTRDTLEDRMKAYVMLYHGLDVVSAHCYSTGLGESEYAVSETDDTMVKEDFKLLMKETRRLGKVFYNGETAVNADTYNEEIYQASLGYIQDIIEAGVQLSHWWTFRNDSKTHRKEGYGWIISDGELLEAIIEGNKQLKETYIVNGIADDNISGVLPEDTVVTVSLCEVDEEKIPKGCGASMGNNVLVFTAAVICIAAFMMISNERKKVR